MSARLTTGLLGCWLIGLDGFDGLLLAAPAAADLLYLFEQYLLFLDSEIATKAEVVKSFGPAGSRNAKAGFIATGTAEITSYHG